MKSDSNIFEEIANQSLGIKKVEALATSLVKSFKPTYAGDLEKANNLAYWLFIHGQNELARRVCQLLSLIPFKNNYNLWTWIELALALEVKLAALAGELDQAQRSIAIIKAPLYLGDEAHRTIKARALSRRLSGDLLQSKAIEEAKKTTDKKAETDYRFVQLKELVYIEALGGSDTQPVTEVQKNIQDNVRKLAD